MNAPPDTGSQAPTPKPVRSGTRWKLLAIGGSVVLAGGLFLAYHWSSPTLGQGPAGPLVAAQDFARAWTERPVVLVGLGDSVTKGFGARRGYGYFDRLLRNPAEEVGGMQSICLTAVLPQLQATNLSISGSVSREVVEHQLPSLPRFGAETIGLVVITTGGNDLIHNYGRTPPREDALYGATLEEAQPWLAHFEARLEAILRELEGRFPGGCHVFLADLYDPTDEVGDLEHAGLPRWPEGRPVLAAANAVIGRFTARHANVHRVPFHATFLGHGIHCAQPWSAHYDRSDPHYWYHDNLEDPNERGYDAIRRLFLLEMVRTREAMFPAGRSAKPSRLRPARRPHGGRTEPAFSLCLSRLCGSLPDLACPGLQDASSPPVRTSNSNHPGTMNTEFVADLPSASGALPVEDPFPPFCVFGSVLLPFRPLSRSSSAPA